MTEEDEKQVIGMLRALEWVYDDYVGSYCCPSCGVPQHVGVHEPDCRLAEILRRVDPP